MFQPSSLMDGALERTQTMGDQNKSEETNATFYEDETARLMLSEAEREAKFKQEQMTPEQRKEKVPA
jgi:hypothetical protein